MNARDDLRDWTPLDPSHWDGDPEKLVGWELEIAENGDLAERLFASEQEAFYTGRILGFRECSAKLEGLELHRGSINRWIARKVRPRR